MTFSEQFPGYAGFFKDSDELDRAISNLAQVLNLNPTGWMQLEKEVIPFLLEQHGLMPVLVKDHEVLTQIIREFLLGQKRVLVAGGSPGNGKSLFVTEIRKYHHIFSNIDESLNFPLAFIPWDKSRACFYEVITEMVGHQVKPPKGVAAPEILDMISEVISDTCQFVLKHHPTARLMVEVPLTGDRGEKVIYDLDKQGIPYNAVAMFSPAMEREIFERGRRDVETSGQPEAMLKMRAEILQRMIGEIQLPSRQQEDEVIFHYWQLLFQLGRQGHVIEWDPNDDRDNFEVTRESFKQKDVKPDDLSPLPLFGFIKRQFETRLELMPAAKRERMIAMAGVIGGL